MTDYAVSPGAYLAEWIEEEGNGITQQQLADKLGVSRKLVNGIINNKEPVTADTAVLLERVTSIPVSAWLKYEAKYREDLVRLKDAQDLGSHISEIPSHVGSFMRKYSITSATARNPSGLVGDFLCFLGFGTFEAYERYADKLLPNIATLKEGQEKDLDRASLMLWITMGERTDVFLSKRIPKYKEESLKKILPQLRNRAAHPDDHMIQDLADILLSVGVVYQFIEAPSKLPLYGITRWINGSTPLIQQTGRLKEDGAIIWTLFHEIGHLLNDQSKGAVLELERNKDTRECEKKANAFAKGVLFGKGGLGNFHGMKWDTEVAQKAKEIGVCPGLAVYEMHKMRMLPYNYGRKLIQKPSIPFAVATL
ncbi:MAG: helix-turn-helix domain-containing protein [Lancefieldella rimae]|uniref:Helix-turn-helix domain-containing protein n=1 Tax=Lancefieldella rimae TaxID=1383 RepID=A0A930VZN2_9ACTN|nr:helix-turn-helix domain-containing protein [Lancefieldella rimae]